MKFRSALALGLILIIACWRPTTAQDLSRLKRFLDSGFSHAETRINPATGTAYMVTVDESELQKRSLDPVLDPLDSLREFLQRTPQLGVVNMDEELIFMDKTNDFQIPGRFQLSFQQVYKGLKVYGTALRVTFNEHNAVLSVTSTIIPDLHLDVVPTLTREEAQSIARASLNSNMTYEASQTELVVYRTGLTQGKVGTNHVTYHVTTVCTEHLDVHHVFVDAHSGAVIDNFTGVHNALSRYVTDYGSKTWIYSEGQGTTGNAEVDTLVAISGQLYTVMMNVGGYDSWDLHGASFKMYTNTRSGAMSGWQCPNAAFIGQYGASFYCPGLGNGIDVVAHEWGHGYISGLAGLQYQYQSGALNEGYADIIGESIQLFMNQPTPYAPRTSRDCLLPADNRRWIIGDQVSNVLSSRNSAGQYIGIRDMYNPNCFGDPASIDDSYMWCNTGDNGGVHTNSGIANQGYALFVDGGVLNGQTVTGVGLLKAYHIYIRALAKHVPTSTFAQHADFLVKACQELSSSAVNLRDPMTGALSGQVVSSGNCASLVQMLTATGMASGKFCGAQGPATPLPVFTPTPTTTTPVAAPVRVPVSVPVSAPVSAPVRAPVAVPVSSPVHVPVAAPVKAPVTVPVSAPVRVPVSVPVAAPVRVPVAAPVHAPAPGRPPVRAPVSSPVKPPTSHPSRPAQVLRGPYPAAVPQTGGDVFWSTRGFNTATDDVWCLINNDQPYKGRLVVNQWSESAVCTTPSMDSAQSFNISVSSDNVVFLGQATIQVYANTVRALDVTPAVGALDGGNEITVKGSGFEQFTGCNPETSYTTSPDCLVCVFGDINERVTPATLIDSTTITCPVPSWYSLAAHNTTVHFYVSLNYWNLIGPLTYQFTGDIAPYVSALPPVQAQPVEQGSVVSAAISTPANFIVAVVVAISMYIL